MVESKKKSITGILVIILILAGFFSILYYKYTQTALEVPTKTVLKPNWYKQIQEGQWSKEIESAKMLSKENKPAEAIKILESVKSRITDPGEKSIVDLTIASNIFTGIDIQQGAERYAQIANTAEYPAISRAFAMMVIADRFNALQDKKLLKPFFDDQEFASKDKSALVSLLFQRTYTTHPFGLVAARLAIEHINKVRKNNTISDSDYMPVGKYTADIEKNLSELETTDAFKTYIPVTLLNKAKLFMLIESLGRPIAQPIPDIYLLAIARARIQRTVLTEQGSILFYADYLAQKKEKDQVIKLLSDSLSSSTLDKALKNLLQSKDWTQTNIPNLYKLQQNDSDVRTVYKRITS